MLRLFPAVTAVDMVVTAVGTAVRTELTAAVRAAIFLTGARAARTVTILGHMAIRITAAAVTVLPDTATIALIRPPITLTSVATEEHADLIFDATRLSS